MEYKEEEVIERALFDFFLNFVQTVTKGMNEVHGKNQILNTSF